MPARIIILNGTSSAGKSTLASALRPALEPTFCYYSSDQLDDAGFRPNQTEARVAGRESFFRGFHLSIAAFATAGNDLLVEHLVEEQDWADDLKRLLYPFEVFWVGVYAPLEEIERREHLRGDRAVGEGRFHLKTHSFCKYDVEVDTMKPIAEQVRQVVNGWRVRGERPGSLTS